MCCQENITLSLPALHVTDCTVNTAITVLISRIRQSKLPNQSAGDREREIIFRNKVCPVHELGNETV